MTKADAGFTAHALMLPGHYVVERGHAEDVTLVSLDAARVPKEERTDSSYISRFLLIVLSLLNPSGWADGVWLLSS